jgi:hypothetical protein
LLTFAGFGANVEAMTLPAKSGRFVHERFDWLIDIEATTRWPEKMMQLGALRDEEHIKMRAREPLKAEIEVGSREEFERLLTDFAAQSVQRKSMFAVIKGSVIDGVAKKIEAAMQVELIVTLKAPREEASARAVNNENIFCKLETENGKLR